MEGKYESYEMSFRIRKVHLPLATRSYTISNKTPRPLNTKEDKNLTTLETFIYGLDTLRQIIRQPNGPPIHRRLFDTTKFGPG